MRKKAEFAAAQTLPDTAPKDLNCAYQGNALSDRSVGKGNPAFMSLVLVGFYVARSALSCIPYSSRKRFRWV